MARETPRFQLPRHLDAYFATLNRLYERDNEPLLRQIIVNGTVSVHEGWDHDNWDGGIDGHAVTLTVPEDIFLRVIDKKEAFQSRITSDLNKLNNIRNEHISEVFVEMSALEQGNWREESGVYRPPMLPHAVSAEALQRIWGSFPVRVFLSHKATAKVETSGLKKSLARCGIGAFVAHDDIEPAQEWQREIERALFSMDALVALLTADFHDSTWTDQEVGVAIGRGVPVIGVRLGLDPYGLLGKGQGLGGCSWSDTDGMALKIFDWLSRRLSDKSLLFDAALTAFAESTGWEDSAWKVEHLFARFMELNPSQVERVLEAYQASKENKYSFAGTRRLVPLLKRWTRKEWTIRDNELSLPLPAETEIPF